MRIFFDVNIKDVRNTDQKCQLWVFMENIWRAVEEDCNVKIPGDIKEEIIQEINSDPNELIHGYIKMADGRSLT